MFRSSSASHPLVCTCAAITLRSFPAVKFENKEETGKRTKRRRFRFRVQNERVGVEWDAGDSSRWRIWDGFILLFENIP
ncbi:uncharacterized protein G2W53_013354 [Senna tora]|uniref:Uncharacterized protein n=1 Tax=Senna tora TaxID=362788 RepID=A0A834WS64_9FABA|nr:uncharacterized protein G2W53_013354 [Senna tora]